VYILNNWSSCNSITFIEYDLNHFTLIRYAHSSHSDFAILNFTVQAYHVRILVSTFLLPIAIDQKVVSIGEYFDLKL